MNHYKLHPSLLHSHPHGGHLLLLKVVHQIKHLLNYSARFFKNPPWNKHQIIILVNLPPSLLEINEKSMEIKTKIFTMFPSITQSTNNDKFFYKDKTYHYCRKKGHIAPAYKKCKYDWANGINKPQANANDIIFLPPNIIIYCWGEITTKLQWQMVLKHRCHSIEDI